MQNIIRLVGVGDRSIFLYINHRIQCGFLNLFMPFCTLLGGATFTVLTSLLLMLFGKGELRLAAAQGSIALSVSFTIGYLVKKILGRPRPYLVIPNTRTGDKIWMDYSFPSGHTAAGFSLAVNYALFYPQLALVLVICAFLVGLSRIYLGQHYPTDVLAGAVLGSSVAGIVFIACSL